jgi:hypothetical protein
VDRNEIELRFRRAGLDPATDPELVFPDARLNRFKGIFYRFVIHEIAAPTSQRREFDTGNRRCQTIPAMPLDQQRAPSMRWRATRGDIVPTDAPAFVGAARHRLCGGALDEGRSRACQVWGHHGAAHGELQVLPCVGRPASMGACPPSPVKGRCNRS